MLASSEVEKLFLKCDSANKGFLTVEDLAQICPQLSSEDITFIFSQLDKDGSGTIEKSEFIIGFEDAVMKGESEGLDGMHRRASVLESDVRYRRAQEEIFDSDAEPSRSKAFRALDDDVYHSETDTALSLDFALPCQEEVIVLYEQLQNSGMPQMLKKFEKVVSSFYKEFKEKTSENARLQYVYENEREMYNRRMEEVETEIDHQLAIAARKARDEERQKLTKEKEEMKDRLESEMDEMRHNIERLQKMEKVLEREGEKLSHQKELQEKLKQVSTENFELRKSMAENHLELAMIKSELAHVRSDYEQSANELQRHQDERFNVAEEAEGAHKQLQLMFEANKKLHETNESLREALDNRASVLRQFNLRTPSPSVFSMHRDSSFSPMHTPILSERLSTPQLMVPQYYNNVEDDIGLQMTMDSDMQDEKPKGDIESLLGINESNGPAERTFRVVMCGDAAVGKSSIVMRLIKGQYTNQLPSTLGVDFHVKTINIDGRNVALQVWDTAGQERFRSLCKSYFRRADGAILVYDVTAEQTFLRVRDWIDTIKESVERSIPVILVGNKTDLRGVSGVDGVPTSDGAAMAATMGILFIEASALNGNNIEPAVLTLARELMAVEDVEIRSSAVILSPRQKQNGGCFSRCKS
ncbi:unnamed protein product [Auanema sp. JU1783]|nr:unnamed protein product [Auanema sp. JU1783]